MINCLAKIFYLVIFCFFLQKIAAAAQLDKGGPSLSFRGELMKCVNLDDKSIFQFLLAARGADYESLRLKLFSDPRSVNDLQKCFGDPDPVVRFIARTLHKWALQQPPEYVEIEDFMSKSIPAMLARDKSVTGGSWTNKLISFLHRKKESGNLFLYEDYLLLKSFMNPALDLKVYSTLLRYYSVSEVREVEVWIRKALEVNDENIYTNIVNYSLTRVERSRLLLALNYERSRKLRQGESFPPILDALRGDLTRQN